MTSAESELLGRRASYDFADMSVGKPGLFERFKNKADDFREYVSTTCCACLASIPSFALVILGVVLIMLLVASIPLAFALTYINGDPAAPEVPMSSVRLFRDHADWSKNSQKAPQTMILQSSSVLPPNITACKGFGFACTNEPSHVIATYQRCDGIAQCADGSDEADCHRCQTTLSCPLKSGESGLKCLRGREICDGKVDCEDGADEKAFCQKECPEDQIKCKNADICVSKNMICDGDAHCPDGEDERGCSQCKNGAKLCKPTLTCIPKWQLCDGNSDCPDSSDELGCDCKTCSGNSRALCDGDVKMCLDKSRICDGNRDCPNGEDEDQCPGFCEIETEESYKLSEGTFRSIKCGNQEYSWQYGCNGLVESCDGFCRTCNPETSFDCHLSSDASSGVTRCIHRSKVCDGKNDCGNNADEENCDCSKPGLHKCKVRSLAGNRSCYSDAQMCDGYNDCPDGEDEKACKICNTGSFHCTADDKCIPSTKRCDGIQDCSDGTDELDCSCQECMMHPFKTYMCSSGSRCFRLDNVCTPFSQCPDADERDKLYCAVSQGGGSSYL